MDILDTEPVRGLHRLVTPANNFSPTDLSSSSPLVARLLAHPRWILSLLRAVWPIPRFAGWAGVTRFDDVREVLAQDSVFQVPFGDKIKELNNGPNFLLGMQDGEDYRRYRSQVVQAFRREDVASIVAPMAYTISEEIVAGCGGRLDAVQDLITRVPLVICERYYGVRVPKGIEVEFAQWTIAMSNYMFGDPGNNPKLRRAATAAGEQVRFLVDSAIETGKRAPLSRDVTVLRRLLAMQADGAAGLTDDVIRAFLIGMITGFVPTNTMAAGNMLEMLLNRGDFLAPACAAALAGDDDLLKRCLFEAMRFMPLNPGPFRVCAQDYTIAKGTRRAKLIKAGTKMLASTQSAMFDPRRVDNPGLFNPSRPALDYMLFGYGRHWCIGAYIAEAQITQMFKCLLMRHNLRRAAGRDGRMQRVGPFPAHLVVEFDA